MITLVGDETEANGSVPRHHKFVAVAAIGHNPAILRLCDLYAVGEMSEHHIEFIVAEDGENGLGERRRHRMRGEVVLVPVRIQIADITALIRCHRIGEFISFVHGDGTDPVCSLSIGSYSYRTTIVCIDSERVNGIR